ncbi:MAG: Gfo/Idh/MocA family oxidoreductase [candidate division KSB1 bacterium]|nr:Gfo/Idh/MocA family oxidoreductase [candidate division KSB1 bacterium]MDZ7304032.1 Gfo/Idh/MocA family oxidoreductase [candidate division KSB1 bacterium]MDZ7313259.1 Gfo/Idh/MocA family oxidoreductase [candidate division KSB1 bacterium]
MEKNMWSRRDMLKVGGALAIGAPMVKSALGKPAEAKPVVFPQDPRFKKPDRPVTAIVLGAGARGNTYAPYSEKFPDELKIVGVAEPIALRRKRFSERYQIPEKYQWVTWEHALQIPKFADALIITTPDHLHYGPAMGGLELGYDLLLEKPIAQKWKECNDIMKLAQKKNRIVAICHVLRYTPYFRKLKEVMDSGQLGDIVSLQHFEPVEHIHMSHSFVRGNWRNSTESNPMLLAKSCHDLDILRWMIGKPCRRVSSFGSLKHFKKENAPAGSTMRCTDGCAVEATCPYSALKIYYRNRTWLHHFDLPQEGEQGPAIMQALQEGPYGRCVYHCDNDVVDHQVVAMEFADQITVAFSMEAFTSYHGRRTRVMGTMGDAVGDMEILNVFDFRTGKQTTWDARQAEQLQSGHGGGDFGLLHDFIQAVSQQDPTLLTSTIAASMESHLIAFKAEESRLSGKTVEVKMS